MRRKEMVSNLATGVMVVCAVLVTGMAVRAQFFPPSPADVDEAPRSIRRWQRLAATGSSLGAADARTTIVEFSDFQCPFCRQLAGTLREMQADDPGRFRVVYRHYPLAQHTHAFDAAVAAECAGEQGRFEPYHDALFAAQDSIGSRGWEAFAAEAGVPDAAAFRACLVRPAVRERVQEDADAAARLRLPGTPSLIVDGRLYSGAITRAELEALLPASR